MLKEFSKKNSIESSCKSRLNKNAAGKQETWWLILELIKINSRFQILVALLLLVALSHFWKKRLAGSLTVALIPAFSFLCDLRKSIKIPISYFQTKSNYTEPSKKKILMFRWFLPMQILSHLSRWTTENVLLTFLIWTVPELTISWNRLKKYSFIFIS